MPTDKSIQVVEHADESSKREVDKHANAPMLKAAAEKRPLAWAVEALKIDLGDSVRKRRTAFLRRMMVCIGLPTLLATAYVFAYATPRYVSEFQITYQSFDATPQVGQASLLSTILGVGGATTVDMSRVVASYLTSSDVLQEVAKKVDIRGH